MCSPFSPLGKLVHILEPTKAAVYLTVRMFSDLNLNSLLRGYRHSIYDLGSKLVLTLNISTSKYPNNWIIRKLRCYESIKFSLFKF